MRKMVRVCAGGEAAGAGGDATWLWTGAWPRAGGRAPDKRAVRLSAGAAQGGVKVAVGAAESRRRRR